MRTTISAIVISATCLFTGMSAQAQCTLTNATTCVCETAGATECDLLPDLMVSWFGLENYLSGPTEYSQANSQSGRLRISASTPNIGRGPLEVRTVNSNSQRRFVCGTDTFSVFQSQSNFTCPNGQDAKQIVYQNIYKKQGGQMVRWERMAGSMTYHAAHSHYHVDDWTTMTLRLEDAGEPDPLKWPVVASGAKIGFCLMDYGSCTAYNGHCRTEPEYGQGTILTTNMFPNMGLNGSYGCGSNIQGISVGVTDIYSKNLDMMWINIMPDLCNGNYWIVAEVDPNNVFLEENDENNWTAVPFAISQQRPNGSGGTAGIFAPDGLTVVEGGSIRLSATPGNSYLWSNGATTRTIDVTAGGDHSVQVTQPCGVLASGIVSVTMVEPPPPPIGTGATVIGPASAEIAATGAGQEIRWYDSATEGDLLGTGGTFTTPVLIENTTYHASTVHTIAGVHAYGAKTDLTGTQGSSNSRQWLYFDASEPFELRSVKVYATGNGERHFVLTDNVGSLLAEKVVYVPAGTHRVDLDFQVPAGVDHRITAFDDNTEIVLQLHRDNSGVSYPYAIGTLGAITGSSAGGSFYYYLYDWEVKVPDVVMESLRTPVHVEVTDGISLLPRFILEGPFDPVTGLMNDALRSSGAIPALEPYTGLGFTHAGDGGGETLDLALLAVTGADAIVDWVLIELRDPVQPAVVLATRSALVKRTGHVISTSGGPVRLPLPVGDYHVAIRHRNHLGCMTAAALTLGAEAISLDMTLAGTQSWGTAARKSVNGTMVSWMGNVVDSGTLKYSGASNDRDPILVAIGGSIPTNSITGYRVEDTNMDGFVRYTGTANDRDPILTNIGGLVPTATRPEQLP